MIQLLNLSEKNLLIPASKFASQTKTLLKCLTEKKGSQYELLDNDMTFDWTNNSGFVGSSKTDIRMDIVWMPVRRSFNSLCARSDRPCSLASSIDF